jgi:transcriptional regulator GlxA family with amidase domain
MVPKKQDTPITLALLAIPGCTPGALLGLHEVLQSVGVIWPMLQGDTPGAPRFDVRLIGPQTTPFNCTNGVQIAPDTSCADMPAPDVALVADLALPPDGDPRGMWPEAADWLRDCFDRGSLVCSVCTGSILLAEAGLLDGREATSHWSVTPLFETFYPDVILRPERILVPTGPEHRIVTGGGASSWEDIALYLVSRFCGPEEAVRTTKIYLFGDRSEGQALYTTMLPAHRHEDGVIAESQSWIAQHYDLANAVTRMVEQSGLPERTFKRRFKATTGYAPVDYVQALRIEEAKQLLETSAMPTDDVAHAVGYEDPSSFRRLFKRKTGVSPGRYRQRFQKVVGAPSQPAGPN